MIGTLGGYCITQPAIAPTALGPTALLPYWKICSPPQFCFEICVLNTARIVEASRISTYMLLTTAYQIFRKCTYLHVHMPLYYNTAAW